MAVIAAAIIRETAIMATEEMITIVAVTEEASVVWREVIPVAVRMMILSRQEPLADSRIRVLAAARARVNNSSHSASAENAKRERKRQLWRFLDFCYDCFGWLGEA